MAEFSPSDAALEGFRVIRRHWRVIAGWGLFNLLAWIAMIMVAAIVLLVFVFATGQSDSSAAMSGVVGAVVYALGLTLIAAVLSCGVFRLMLRPEEPAFLHLRLGPDEFRNMTLGVLMIAGIALLAGVAVLAGKTLRPLGGGLPVLAALVTLGLGVWLLLRVYIAFPWTFDAHRLVVAPAWQATRGSGWSLLGMWLLNISAVAVVALVVWLGLFAATGLLSGFDGLFSSLSNAEAMEARPGRYLLQLAIQVALAPFVTVLTTAPVVAAYRALAGD